MPEGHQHQQSLIHHAASHLFSVLSFEKPLSAIACHMSGAVMPLSCRNSSTARRQPVKLEVKKGRPEEARDASSSVHLRALTALHQHGFAKTTSADPRACATYLP